MTKQDKHLELATTTSLLKMLRWAVMMAVFVILDRLASSYEI